MKLKQKIDSKVVVCVKDPKTNKSKTITVYDCSIEEMVDAIKKIVADNAT